MPFIVITAGEELPEFAVLTAVLGAALKTDRDTAAGAARRSWGLLGRNLDEAAAAELEARCADFDIKTLRLPWPQPPLPAAEKLKAASFSAGAAVFSLAGGAVVQVAPGDITVIAAAPLREETTRLVKTTEGPSSGEKALRMGIMAVTGLPIGMGKSKEVKKEVKSSETSFCLDLLLDRQGRRLRANPADFDFSCLKEKKTYSSQVNLRLLCAEAAAFAPAAARNAGLLAMLQARPLAALPYDSLEDLETEELRLLLAVRGA